MARLPGNDCHSNDISRCILRDSSSPIKPRNPRARPHLPISARRIFPGSRLLLPRISHATKTIVIGGHFVAGTQVTEAIMQNSRGRRRIADKYCIMLNYTRRWRPTPSRLACHLCHSSVVNVLFRSPLPADGPASTVLSHTAANRRRRLTANQYDHLDGGYIFPPR